MQPVIGSMKFLATYPISGSPLDFFCKPMLSSTKLFVIWGEITRWQSPPKLHTALVSRVFERDCFDSLNLWFFSCSKILSCLLLVMLLYFLSDQHLFSDQRLAVSSQLKFKSQKNPICMFWPVFFMPLYAYLHRIASNFSWPLKAECWKPIR